MALTKWNPYQSSPWPLWPFYPKDDWVRGDSADGLDVYETDGEVVVEAAIPGLRDRDVNVSFEDGILRVWGERDISDGDRKKRKNVYRESTYTSFDYMTTLPRTVDPDKISADVEDGIVYVTAPIARESRPKRIEAKKRAGKKDNK